MWMMALTYKVGVSRDDRVLARLWWRSSRLRTEVGTRRPIRVLKEVIPMVMMILMMWMPLDLVDLED
jgi:hypothetical protein